MKEITKKSFPQLYHGIGSLFIAAGFSTSTDGNGLVVYGEGETLSADLKKTTDIVMEFISILYKVNVKHHPIEGENAVLLTLEK